MQCAHCGSSNEPNATFCHQCGRPLDRAAAVAPPAAPAPTYGTPPAAVPPAPLLTAAGGSTAELPYRSYFRSLIFWGLAAIIIGWILIGTGLNSATNDFGDTTSTNSDGAKVVFGFLFTGLGSVLLLPGLIGWGIHASGLTRSKIAPPPRVTKPPAGH